MSDQLAEHLGIDPGTPSARLARSNARSDLEMTLALVAQRKARGLTVEHVAEQLGRTPEQIREFERLEEDPRLSTVRQYALVAGARIDHQITEAHTTEAESEQGSPEEILDLIIQLERPCWSAESSIFHEDEFDIMTRSSEDLTDPLLEASGLTYTDHGTMDELEARYIASVSPQHRIAPLLRELMELRQR